MKKRFQILMLLIAFVLLFSLAACGGSSDAKDADAKDSGTNESEEPKLCVITNDRVVFDDHNDYDALIVDVKVTNMGEENAEIGDVFKFNVYQVVDGENTYLNYTFAKDSDGNELDTMDRYCTIKAGDTYSFTTGWQCYDKDADVVIEIKDPASNEVVDTYTFSIADRHTDEYLDARG